MRDAVRADIPELVPLINDAYRARDGWLFGEQRRTDRDELAAELTDAATTGIIAEVDGATAGFAVVRLRREHAEFGLLATALQFQGRGLARMIVDRAESMARAAGCSAMALGCIEENRLPSFYAALGYAEVSRERATRWDSLEPFTLVEMRKALT
jgi:GNAT superfamily N-acetyltransferase